MVAFCTGSERLNPWYSAAVETSTVSHFYKGWHTRALCVTGTTGYYGCIEGSHKLHINPYSDMWYCILKVFQPNQNNQVQKLKIHEPIHLTFKTNAVNGYNLELPEERYSHFVTGCCLNEKCPIFSWILPHQTLPQPQFTCSHSLQHAHNSKPAMPVVNCTRLDNRCVINKEIGQTGRQQCKEKSFRFITLETIDWTLSLIPLLLTLFSSKNMMHRRMNLFSS